MSADPRKTTTAAHLRELQDEGVLLSRNRNFDFFQEPGNRKALDLRRRFERLESIICRAHTEKKLGLALEKVDSAHLDLVIDLPRFAARYAARMTLEEFQLFVEREAIARVLREQGIDPTAFY